jgi:hypothetical protein
MHGMTLTKKALRILGVLVMQQQLCMPSFLIGVILVRPHSSCVKA